MKIKTDIPDSKEDQRKELESIGAAVKAKALLKRMKTSPCMQDYEEYERCFAICSAFMQDREERHMLNHIEPCMMRLSPLDYCSCLY